MKIVINTCFGGFGLSPLAQREYLKRKGKEAFFYSQTKYSFREGTEEWERVEPEGNNRLFIRTLTKDLGRTVSELKYEESVWFSDGRIERTDPDLIAVVESLGDDASGQCADLKVVEIPDGIEWEINEYDGSETIHEKHRSWG